MLPLHLLRHIAECQDLTLRIIGWRLLHPQFNQPRDGTSQHGSELCPACCPRHLFDPFEPNFVETGILHQALNLQHPADPCAIQKPRQIPRLLGEQEGDVLRIVLQIGVDCDDDVTRGIINASHDRRALARIAAELDNLQFRAQRCSMASSSADRSVLPSLTAMISKLRSIMSGVVNNLSKRIGIFSISLKIGTTTETLLLPNRDLGLSREYDVFCTANPLLGCFEYL
jgi:hypothetical protein